MKQEPKVTQEILAQEKPEPQARQELWVKQEIQEPKERQALRARQELWVKQAHKARPELSEALEPQARREP